MSFRDSQALRAVFAATGFALAIAIWPVGSAQAESAPADALSCDSVIAAIMQGRDTTEVVREAALAGMAASDVALCARNAGASVDDVLAGLDAAKVAPGTVAQIAESLDATAGGTIDLAETDILPADVGESPIAQEFAFLADVTRASGYQEDLVGCSIVAKMVRDHPNDVEEVVRSAAGTGMHPDDVASCALAAGAAPDDVFAGLLQSNLPPDVVAEIAEGVEPAAGSTSPLPQTDGGQDITDPALGEPKIIRPTENVGAPDAASPA